jgi:hypothetical protein
MRDTRVTRLPVLPTQIRTLRTSLPPPFPPHLVQDWSGESDDTTARGVAASPYAPAYPSRTSRRSPERGEVQMPLAHSGAPSSVEVGWVGWRDWARGSFGVVLDRFRVGLVSGLGLTDTGARPPR